MEQVVNGLIWYVVFLFSICCHEAAHALASYKLGDDTAYLGGQVSLNPVPHVRREPFGTVIVPLISFFAGGWMIGWASAPYDPHWAERYPKRSALMSLAGPFANLLLVLFSAIVIRIGLGLDLFQIPEQLSFTGIVTASHEGVFSGLALMISILFSLNMLLFVFNLIPLPPLDGSGAIPLLLPDKLAYKYVAFFHENSSYQFIFLIVAWKVVGPIFRPCFSVALDLLFLGV
jgi:Zn-dependent protease